MAFCRVLEFINHVVIIVVTFLNEMIIFPEGFRKL